MEKKKSSKELLKESVIELVSRSPVEKVSVDQICENCGVSRRSFYNHFKDKHELICWVYISIVEDNIREHGSELTLHTQIESLVNSICDLSGFYQNAVRYTGQNNFRESILEPLIESVRSLITDVYRDEISPELDESIAFFVYGCIGYMEHNLLINNIVPADITVPLFERNIPECLRKYLSSV